MNPLSGDVMADLLIRRQPAIGIQTLCSKNTGLSSLLFLRSIPTYGSKAAAAIRR